MAQVEKARLAAKSEETDQEGMFEWLRKSRNLCKNLVAVTSFIHSRADDTKSVGKTDQKHLLIFKS